MNDALKVAIDELIADISAKERELDPLKSAVNTLCRKVGIPDAYVIGENPEGTSSRQTITWRLDQFTNRPLATCAVEILEIRKDRGLDGPASIDEIFTALTEGGFKFQGTSGSDENTKRGIKIALTKNTAQFVKIRDDIFGLKRWYGGSRTIQTRRRVRSLELEDGLDVDPAEEEPIAESDDANTEPTDHDENP